MEFIGHRVDGWDKFQTRCVDFFCFFFLDNGLSFYGSTRWPSSDNTDVAKNTGPPLLSGRVSSFVVQTIRIVTEKDVLKKLTTMEAMTMDARDWQTEGRRSSHFRLPH